MNTCLYICTSCCSTCRMPCASCRFRISMYFSLAGCGGGFLDWAYNPCSTSTGSRSVHFHSQKKVCAQQKMGLLRTTVLHRSASWCKTWLWNTGAHLAHSAVAGPKGLRNAILSFLQKLGNPEAPCSCINFHCPSGFVKVFWWTALRMNSSSVA